MPTYKNNTSGPLTPPGYDTLQPGDSFSPQKYLYPPVSGLDLIAHGPAPWVTVHDDSLPASLSGLAKYRQIIIGNESGQTIEIVANENTANQRKALDGTELILSQEQDIEKLDISGTGAGSVYVYGLE